MSRRVFFQHAGLAIGVTRVAWITAGVLMALPALGAATDAAREETPITDPVLLERLGFEPDATNVYATPQALGQLLMDPAERAASEAEPSAGQSSPFGTATSGYTSIDDTKFLPRTSSHQYGYLTGPDGGRYCVSDGRF